jgi:hypothetical protein
MDLGERRGKKEMSELIELSTCKEPKIKRIIGPAPEISFRFSSLISYILFFGTAEYSCVRNVICTSVVTGSSVPRKFLLP